MRIAAVLVSLILFPASTLVAGPVLFMEFLNSDFTFGTVSPNQEGHDLSALSIDSAPPDIDSWDGAYQLQSGALVQQTLDVDGSGEVTGSSYAYTGGTFEVVFFLEKDGVPIVGSFVAPIKTLSVWAGEAAGELTFATYVLGPGLFDQSIADALGIGRHTSGGEASSQLLLTDSGNRPGIAGDHSTPERQAWDGVNDISLTVPEPATAALLAGALAVVWIRRRAR